MNVIDEAIRDLQAMHDRQAGKVEECMKAVQTAQEALDWANARRLGLFDALSLLKMKKEKAEADEKKGTEP